LITQEYQDQMRQKHEEHRNWGTTARTMGGVVQRIINDWAPRNVLDYGCGKQGLSR